MAVVGGGGVRPCRCVGRRAPVLDLPVVVEGGEVGPGGSVGAVLVAVGVGLDDVVVVPDQVDGGGRLDHRQVVAVGLDLPGALGPAVGAEGDEAPAGAAGGGIEAVAVTAGGEAEDGPVDLGLPRRRLAGPGVEA